MNKILFRECMKGKSLLRTLQNLEFNNKELEQLRMLDEYREDIMKDDEEEGMVEEILSHI